MSDAELTCAVVTLAELQHMRGVRLLEDSQFRQLLEVAELRGCGTRWAGELESPRSRLVVASPLQLRRGLKQNVRAFKDWSRQDLADGVQAISWRSRTPRQQTLYERAVDRQDTPIASFKLAASLVGRLASSGP